MTPRLQLEQYTRRNRMHVILLVFFTTTRGPSQSSKSIISRSLPSTQKSFRHLSTSQSILVPFTNTATIPMSSSYYDSLPGSSARNYSPYARPLSTISAYRFFFHYHKGQVQNEYWIATGKRMDFLTLTNRMADMWDNADSATKAYYAQLEKKDERRFLLEHMVWEAKCKELEEAQGRD